MPYKILLVDDSPEDRETYRRFLSRERDNSYEVIEAETLGEGLELYRREAPDLILLDYLLPDGTGIDFIEEGGSEIRCPIVVLTGQGNVRIAVEMMKAGAVDYLVKEDLNPSLLNRIAGAAIERHALLKEIENEREERRLVAALALRIRESLDLEAILNTTVTEVREFIRADRVLIYRFNSDMSGTIVAESVGAPWRECLHERVEDTYFQGDGGREYTNGKIAVIADVGAENYSECHLELLQRFEARAKVVAPLLLGLEKGREGGSERLWGLLVVHQCSGPRQWRESEIRCLQQLSVHLGIAIGQAKLYKAIQQANERLEKTVALRTEELIKTQEKLNLIIEGSGDGVWYFDLIANTIYLSPRYRQLLGYEEEPDVWPWAKARELLHPEDGEALWNSHLRYLESGASGIHEFEFRQRCKNGEYKYFYSRGKAILDGTGRALFMAGTSTDITERKRLEQELRTANALLNQIFDNSPVGMGLLDSRDRYIRINETLALINGFPPDEHIGKTVAELLPDIAPALTPLIQKIRDTGVGINNIEIAGTTPARPDITRYWTLSYYPVELPDGETGIGAMVTEITALKEAERALTESEEKFRQIAETIEEIFWVASIDFDSVFYVNPAFEKITGYPAGALYENPYLWREIIVPDDRPRVESSLSMATNEGIYNVEYRIVRADGEIRWIHDRSFPVRTPSGKIERQIGIAIDITERKCLEDSLFQEKELAEITLKSIGDCVVTTDAVGRVTYLNPVAEELLGLTDREAAGQDLTAIFSLLDEIDRSPIANPVERVLQDRRVTRLSEGTLLVARNGREYAVADSAAPILDRSGQLRGTVLILNDVTETRAMTRQLRERAERDALTGLFNRFYFERELERAIAEVKADSSAEHTLCYLDLDKFKIVNDTCGHAAGDELLRQLSDLLRSRVRSTDTLARLGGDEFALLLYRCPLARGRAIAEGIVEAVREFEFVRDGKIFRVGVSVGLAAFDSTVESSEKLALAADVACYAAKEAGRNRVHVYRERDERLNRARRERQWVLEVRSAIEEKRLCLYHQAIAPANPARSEAPFAEILLRLRQRDGRIVSPMTFLPAMERYGLMGEVDRAVVRLLLDYLENRNDPGEVRYMINLSGASVGDSGFLDFLVGEIEGRGVRPGSLGFEITETVAVSNFATAKAFIGRLRELGCHFALDDFGSGMSSFAYLKNLPVDYLKIDGHFVRDILDDPFDGQIVSAIGAIASSLGIRTVAEFVESDAIRERLIEIGIDYVQGYGVAPVLPLGNG
jgi:diguanylate cyclase (GGDEF)-like protein/PAS domain S-box-containing protein